VQPRLISVLLAGWFATAGTAPAQTLDLEISGLAGKLSKALVDKGVKNVAAIDFTDLQGQPTEMGRFLAEQLAVEIVSTGGVSMVDRANIKSILAEHKLTEEGLVNPANAKKLGEFAGVDAILIGNVTALDDGIVLMVKAISTGSANIVAAGRVKFPKTSEIQQLLNRSVSGSSVSGASPVAAREGSGAAYQDATAIATKDLGSLRVVLKSAMPLKLSSPYEGKVGIRLSFDFISRETQRPLIVGLNATQRGAYNIGDCKLDDWLRSSLVDSNGSSYRLPNTSLTGVGIIGVGCEEMKGYDASQVVSLLEKQDREGSRGQRAGEYVYGSTSIISPGQSVSVTMNFVRDDNAARQESRPKFFQIGCEIVIGVVGTDGKKSYSLQNLALDRVSIPTF
jgi:hypothetical protein